MHVPLTDLHPHFVRYETRIEKWTVAVGDPLTWTNGGPTEEREGPREHITYVDSLSEAQGIWFLCPKCYVDRGNSSVGTHSVSVAFADRNVLPNQGSQGDAGPSRWTVVSGTDFSDLTLTPSILLRSGCGWHGYITNGQATSV